MTTKPRIRVHIDIETRSMCDLTRCGVYVYAADSSTKILVVCWAVEDQPVETWFPHRGAMPFELEMLLALKPDAIEWCAHNASFERNVLGAAPGRRIGFPEGFSSLAYWDCTAARAARWGLPRSLDGAARALSCTFRKDKGGYTLMMRMCKPLPVNQRARGFWLEDEESFTRLGEYCVLDVETEREIDGRILPLSAFERAVWEMTERANDTGVLVDDVLMSCAADMVDRAEVYVNDRLNRLTNGRVKKVTNHTAITEWLQGFNADDSDLVEDDVRELGKDGVGKAALAAMLERDDLPDIVREVLLLRQANGKSSAAKYRAIVKRLSADHRIRGVLVYCGAASTGRWSSRGAQLHNLPRSLKVANLATVEQIKRDLLAGCSIEDIAEFYGPPMVIASELLRPTFMAPAGKKLVRGDSSQIEARVAPWLAGAEWKLEAFRRYDNGTGKGLYEIGAGGIYGVPPESIGKEDPRRQIGKVSELSLQFQGGARALQAMAKGYGVKIPRYVHDPKVAYFDRPPTPAGTDEWIKEQWREANPEIVALWGTMNQAAVDCMSAPPGALFPAGKHINFWRNGSILVMRLPKSRLVYWNPCLVESVTPWGKTQLSVRYWAEDSQSKQWRPFIAYGGLFFENAVQATARDAMAYWSLEMERAGMPPILSVHDEGVGESDAPDAEDVLRHIMKSGVPFLPGLPVNTDVSSGPRYLK